MEQKNVFDKEINRRFRWKDESTESGTGQSGPNWHFGEYINDGIGNEGDYHLSTLTGGISKKERIGVDPCFISWVYKGTVQHITYNNAVAAGYTGTEPEFYMMLASIGNINTILESIIG